MFGCQCSFGGILRKLDQEGGLGEGRAVVVHVRHLNRHLDR